MKKELQGEATSSIYFTGTPCKIWLVNNLLNSDNYEYYNNDALIGSKVFHHDTWVHITGLVLRHSGGGGNPPQTTEYKASVVRMCTCVVIMSFFFCL